MQLYGTTTSPFVRRVRVVAAELGVPVDRVDTAGDAGLARLRGVSPIAKVPVAIVDGRTLFDSRAIMEWLIATRGYGELTPPRDRWREQNLINAIDGALDSIVQVFLLRRDGVAVDGSVFARRQLDRADAIFGWLAEQLAPDRDSFDRGFGIAELSAICALDWMDFRASYPTERAAGLTAMRRAWSGRG
ncbi:MAG: glutathione S-transferase family protein, partial [Kofleriaceae bacterium]